MLARLRTALKPGGWLVCEEFDSESMPPDPTVSTGERLLRTQVAMGRLMADRGFDRRFGRRLFAHLRAQGLADVGAEARLFMVQGGSPGADLVRSNCRAASQRDDRRGRRHRPRDRSRSGPLERATVHDAVVDHVGRVGPPAAGDR